MLNHIRVVKAAQHNLKNLSVELPRNRLVVITGPSGSGKSSLAFDTLFAEGQRRYIECLSTYARQYIEQMEKPAVESIEGLSPSISIDQRTISSNPRSTVGTVTEAYDFLRLLFARIGTPHCPKCGRGVSTQTRDQVLQRIQAAYQGELIQLYAPVVKGRKGEFLRLFERLLKKGYLRARVDGEMRELEDDIILEKAKQHDIEVLVDEVDVLPDSTGRLQEAIRTALELADGNLLAVTRDARETYYSLKLLCPYCDINLPVLEPRSFSFNNPYGACPACHGLGVRSVRNSKGEDELTDEACPQCGGYRLKPQSLAVRVGGRNIWDWNLLPIDQVCGDLRALKLGRVQEIIGRRILREILSRLDTIVELGMGYLQLSRTAASLSGGEARRVRLAAQIGASLRGVLYVLDEPTIGLHQQDNDRLIRLLRDLRDRGNSVLVVEHDEQTIRAADYILDLGPGAGEGGGFKVAEGSLEEILDVSDSLTSQYLRREKVIPIPSKRRHPKGWLEVKGAAEHNLKNIDVSLPLGVMGVVTGVSGSGKSTLLYEIVHKALINRLYRAKQRAGKHESLEGIDQIDKVVSVDQKPIGRTPRSNPATYTGLFTTLRTMFAMTRESRARGYSPGRFSFNVPGGRCEECKGAGVKKIEMHFLPDVFVTCDRCGGRRYNKETLAVTYKGGNIADYLEMTVDESYEFLKSHPALKRKLMVLRQVGLGYLRLGQPAPTLSGGEAQRIKLTKELSRKKTGRTLYLLDEPTTGLHFEDVFKLLSVLSDLVEMGNTVMMIEHNLEVIKVSDYIIDLGPGGGAAGGRIVVEGTPEEVARHQDSHTARFLARALLPG